VGESGADGLVKAGRRLSRGAAPSTSSSSSKEKTPVAASDIEHCRSAAQLALTLSPQPTNGHRSQPLSGLQTIDLGGIEGQARKARAPPQRCCSSPQPSLSSRYASSSMSQRGRNARPRGKAIGEPTGTHQRSGRLGGCFLGGYITDEAGPQTGIGHAIAGRRLGKPIPTRQFPRCRYFHFA
jgi:hypothetical protein